MRTSAYTRCGPMHSTHAVLLCISCGHYLCDCHTVSSAYTSAWTNLPLCKLGATSVRARYSHLRLPTQAPYCEIWVCGLGSIFGMQGDMQELMQAKHADLQHELQRALRCVIGVPPCCGFQQGESQGPA